VAESALTLLRRLESVQAAYAPPATRAKLVLLQRLERRRFRSPRALLRFHESVCFLRAYPDSRAVRSTVDRILTGFDARRDLLRFREDLADSGVAGTPIHYPFFWPTADWLAARWPKRLRLDWEAFETAEGLTDRLPYLLPYSESPALDMLTLSPREWVAKLKHPRESDAVFLVQRFRGLAVDPFLRRKLFDDLDPPFRLEPGPDTPSRTRARYPGAPVVFQKRPLDTARPSLREAIREEPRAVRAVPPAEGQRLIDLAREAMITRARDLDVFMHGDAADVRLVDFGDGLQFAAIGASPEKRLLLEAVYGFLTLKNGIPIGYVLASAFMGSSEIAYNVFETYRGGESGAVFGRVLAMVRHLFGSDSFTLDPYQLGLGNMEGLRSGAWWFYYKMGFWPHDAGVRRLVGQETAKMKRNPGHRSSLHVLERLAAKPLFYHAARERHDVLGRLDLGAIGLAISRGLARRAGGDREAGLAAASDAARRALGVRSLARFTPGERIAWDRWAPLVVLLPGLARWTTEQKRDLVRVVRAKGGRRESAFVHCFDAHRRLRTAVYRLSLTKG
jgi:hypothetical protein